MQKLLDAYMAHFYLEQYHEPLERYDNNDNLNGFNDNNCWHRKGVRRV